MNPQFADKCNTRWNRNLPPHAASILHATTGIMLELREFHKSTSEGNGKEELGDLLYFVHMIWHDIGRPELETAGDIVAGSLDDAIYTLAEEAKRYAVYWTPEKDAHLRKCVTEALADLDRGLHRHFGDQLEPAMEANDRKLTTRYGGTTFVAEKATERDLDKEMAALAGGIRNVSIESTNVIHGRTQDEPKNVLSIIYLRSTGENALPLPSTSDDGRDDFAAPPRPGSGDGSDDLADHNAAQADEGH